MKFFNDQEQLETLPSITNLQYQPVEKSYLKVMIIGTLIMGVIFSIITVTLYINIDEEKIIWLPHLLGAVFTLIFSLSLVSSFQNFKRIGYALRQRDIAYKKGWIWQSKIIIPFNRIQHSEVNQNPVERIFGLAKLKVFTAGGSSSDLSIPGLTPERAEQLKFYITHKAAVDEEE